MQGGQRHCQMLPFCACRLEMTRTIMIRVMSNPISFNDVLEAVDHLSLDEQESLIDVIRRRIAAHRRQDIAKLVTSAKDEYKNGKLVPETPDEIMRSILS